mmetsp:Transcript_37162/g.61176  ORF Transcript_37162/g.61176 Transcript_37162/m.61176 type:complete len:212 (+) Transcript_37162:356-991(+)
MRRQIARGDLQLVFQGLGFDVEHLQLVLGIDQQRLPSTLVETQGGDHLLPRGDGAVQGQRIKVPELHGSRHVAAEEPLRVVRATGGEVSHGTQVLLKGCDDGLVLAIQQQNAMVVPRGRQQHAPREAHGAHRAAADLRGQRRAPDLKLLHVHIEQACASHLAGRHDLAVRCDGRGCQMVQSLFAPVLTLHFPRQNDRDDLLNLGFDEFSVQ